MKSKNKNGTMLSRTYTAYGCFQIGPLNSCSCFCILVVTYQALGYFPSVCAKSMPLTEEIPDHLKPFIVQQDASLYTAIDHASWRFILKIARNFFAKHAHQKYLDGLRETGISTERIPLIDEMDTKLRQFGWRAVAVSGFIPPAAFMEYLSLGILPIACDMRQLDHIDYTPAPDIVHEAAGHAPIIADPAYAEYLRCYGEISRKAIMSKQDLDVYEAVRNLSEVKEDPKASKSDIAAAQKQLDKALAAVDYVSEATQLSRMGWWTFEYGLIGPIDNPKIYGAGLLSSVSESYHFLDKKVKKVPFSVECIETNFDITKPQPQLFVSPNFEALVKGLHDLENQMAYKRGGVEGLEKAQRSQLPNTVVYDSGVQVSGVLTAFKLHGKLNPSYLQFTGSVQLAYNDSEIEGQGVAQHQQGFGSPVGKFKETKPGRLEFESGVVVEGKLKNTYKQNGKTLIMSFENCTVKLGNEILFKPEWGTYDMACGEKIVSVFGGPADRKKYLALTGGFHQKPQMQKSNLTNENKNLCELYSKVRKMRESKNADASEINKIVSELEKKYPQDWLLRYELLELDKSLELHADWKSQLKKELDQITKSSKGISELVKRGLENL
jgi:phenylalanine-4-hydroxylase